MDRNIICFPGIRHRSCNGKGRRIIRAHNTDKLIAIIDRYAAQDTWKEDCIFTEEAFNLLQNILDQAGELTERVDYGTLITTEFAEKAVQE